MKDFRYRIRLFSILFFGSALLSLSSFGSPFEIRVRPAEVEVLPGEPLYLHLYATRGKGEGAESETPLTLSMSSAQMEIEVLDSDGNMVGLRPKEEWYPMGGGSYCTVDFAPGEQFKKTVIVHRWCSTELPEGKYTLVFRLKDLKYGEKKPGVSRYIKSIASVGNTWRFPIAVLPRDDVAVRTVFEGLVEKSVRADTSREAGRQSLLASDSIIYAQGPLALPYQLELIRKTLGEHQPIIWGDTRLLDMFRYIAHSGDADAAKQLLEFSKADFFAKSREAKEVGRGVWGFLVWAIHELYGSGSEDVRAIVSEFVEEYPVVRPPMTSDYFYTRGPPEDY